VKNNLQTVASMLNLQPISPDIKRQMNHRIGAMSALHEQIYRSSDFARVAAKDYLETIIDRIRSSQESAVELVADLEPMTVGKDAATHLGLLVNEVVNNALKHGFPEGRSGTVRITLKEQIDNRVELTVEDDGVGFTDTKSSQGIGMRLVDALTAQLGGESAFSGEGGTKFTLTFPNSR
jgi:two-component sensor histidine kinase